MTNDHLTALLTRQLAEAEKTVQMLEKELLDLELSAEIQQESGSLKRRNNNGSDQYYLRRGKGDGGRYFLPKKEEDMIRELSVKQYYTELLDAAKGNQMRIQQMLMSAKRLQNLEQKSRALLEYYPLVETPSLCSEEGFLKWWKENRTRCNPYRPEEKIYPAHDGAMVRSKSEQSIYNELLDYGVPFQYELELNVQGRPYYPDFTLLDVANCKEVYFEHYGMMDDPKYRQHYYQKMDAYRAYGLKDGEDFFCTFEEPGHPFDIRKVIQFLESRFPRENMS